MSLPLPSKHNTRTWAEKTQGANRLREDMSGFEVVKGWRIERRFMKVNCILPLGCSSETERLRERPRHDEGASRCTVGSRKYVARASFPSGQRLG